MSSDATLSGVRLARQSHRPPELRFGDRRFKADVGDAADVWDVIYAIVPQAEEDEGLRARVLDAVNDRRLVVVHRLIGGEPVEFLYSRCLLERALTGVR